MDNLSQFRHLAQSGGLDRAAYMQEITLITILIRPTENESGPANI